MFAGRSSLFASWSTQGASVPDGSRRLAGTADATLSPQFVALRGGFERSRAVDSERQAAGDACRTPVLYGATVNGAAPESNRPSRGLHDRTGLQTG